MVARRPKISGIRKAIDPEDKGIQAILLQVFTKLDISSYARRGFNLVSRLCQKYCLVPITQLENGNFAEASRDQKFKCYLFSTYGALTCVYKLWGTATLALQSGFHVNVAVCIASFVLTFVSWLPSFAFIFVQNESVALLNTLVPALEYLDRKCGGAKRQQFTNKLTCLKIICVTTLPAFAPLLTVVAMLLFDDLPVAGIGIALHTNLVTKPGLLYVAGFMATMIIESVTSFLLWMNIAMVLHISFVATEVLNIFLEDNG